MEGLGDEFVVHGYMSTFFQGHSAQPSERKIAPDSRRRLALMR